jgi:CRP-like cAMP-binding protein
MEQKFGTNSIDLQVLRDFCEREGKSVCYQKGEQMEREGNPSQWFGFVTEGCFKYVTQGISDNKEHITWFSFEGEFAGDYPACLDGKPSMTTIEAMLPTRVLMVSGEQLMGLFRQNMEMMALRGIIGEHLLSQARARYLDFHRTTPRERYDLLLRRCPGIVEHLPLNAIASFLNITPKTISIIRRDITYNSMVRKEKPLPK